MKQPERHQVETFFDLPKEDKVQKEVEEEEDGNIPDTREQSCLKFEHMLWFELGKNIRKSHRYIYKEHLDHLKTYDQNPYKYLIIEYTKKMRTLFEYNKYLQLPRMRSQLSLEAYWYKHNEPVTEKVTRKSTWEELHETM